MTDKLNALWNAYRETPFLTTGISRKLPELSTDALAGIEALLKTMSDSGETKDGYRVKRVASNLYKLIALQQGDDEKGKGKSLINEKESLTGEIRSPITDPHPPNEPCERFSFFPSAKQSHYTTEDGNICQLHKQITTNAAWKLKIDNLRRLSGEAFKDAKESLPAFTPSVLLTTGKRANLSDADFTHTRLIQADFDQCADPDTLLNTLKSDPHCRLVFRSPSGKAKALVRVASVNTVEEHNAAFQAVADYCRAQGYGDIDPVCKDIAHLCFISFDPQAVLKDAEPLPFTIQPTPPRRHPEPQQPHQKTDISQVINALNAIPADEYKSHWVEVGMALYHSDIDEDDAFQLWDAWSHKSTRYDQEPEQMKEKWDSFATDKDIKHGLRYIYYLARQYGFNPPRDDTPNLRPQRRSTPNLRPRRRNPNLRPQRRNPNLRRHSSKRRSTTP